MHDNPISNIICNVYSLVNQHMLCQWGRVITDIIICFLVNDSSAGPITQPGSSYNPLRIFRYLPSFIKNSHFSSVYYVFLISTGHAHVKGMHAPPCIPRPMAGGPGPPCIFTNRQGTELVEPWLGVRSAGPRP